MKHSIRSLIDTLGVNDFVNVANVRVTCCGCYTSAHPIAAGPDALCFQVVRPSVGAYVRNCRILYGHLCPQQLHLLVIIIISFSSPTLSFIPDLEHFFQIFPTAAFLFLFFRTDYMISQTFTVTSNISAFTFQFFSVLQFLVVVSVR